MSLLKKGQEIDFISRKGRATLESIPHFTLGKGYRSNKWGVSIHWKYRGKPVWWLLTFEDEYLKALSQAFSYAKYYNLTLIKPSRSTLFNVLWAPGEVSSTHKWRRKFFIKELNIEWRKKKKAEKENPPS
jgi:hypothetical protein